MQATNPNPDPGAAPARPDHARYDGRAHGEPPGLTMGDMRRTAPLAYYAALEGLRRGYPGRPFVGTGAGVGPERGAAMIWAHARALGLAASGHIDEANAILDFVRDLFAGPFGRPLVSHPAPEVIEEQRRLLGADPGALARCRECFGARHVDGPCTPDQVRAELTGTPPPPGGYTCPVCNGSGRAIPAHTDEAA